MKRDVRVVTDSLGRFEFPLPKAELSALQLSHAGYISRPAISRVQRGDTTSLVLLMKRGEDPKQLRFALSDLSHRMAWSGIGTLVANRAQLTRYGARTLEDGIFRSSSPAWTSLRYGAATQNISSTLARRSVRCCRHDSSRRRSMGFSVAHKPVVTNPSRIPLNWTDLTA
jgi:hypothetical protein